MVEANDRFEVKLIRRSCKADKSDATTEHVTNPSDVFWLRIDLQMRIQQRLIETVLGLNIKRCSPNSTGLLYR